MFHISLSTQVKDLYRQKSCQLQHLQEQYDLLKVEIQHRDSSIFNLKQEFEDSCGFSMDSWSNLNSTVDRLRADLERANSRSTEEWAAKDAEINQLQVDLKKANSRSSEEWAAKDAEINQLQVDLKKLIAVPVKNGLQRMQRSISCKSI